MLYSYSFFLLFTLLVSVTYSIDLDWLDPTARNGFVLILLRLCIHYLRSQGLITQMPNCMTLLKNLGYSLLKGMWGVLETSTEINSYIFYFLHSLFTYVEPTNSTDLYVVAQNLTMVQVYEWDSCK